MSRDTAPAGWAACATMLCVAVLATFIMASRPYAASATDMNTPIIAVDDYPPYHYWKDGIPQGLHIEILEEVFTRIGLAPRFVKRPWKQGLNELKHGELTALCAGMKTPAREKFAFYPSRHLSLETNWVISLADSKLELSHAQDLAGLSIGTVAHYSYGPTFDSLPNLSKTECRNEQEMIELLVNKRVDVAVGSDLVINHIASTLGVSHLLGYKLKLTSDPLYLILSKAVKGNEELNGKVSNALSRMVMDGTYDQLIQRYLGVSRIPTYTIVTDYWPPFRMQDGRESIVGIDKDIMNEIGKRMGVKFIWQRRPWVRCLHEIENGHADVITGVARTPEREEYTLYTRLPYYELGPAFYTHDQSLAQSINGYPDLYGISIGYTRGSSYFNRFDTDDKLDKHAGTDEAQLLKMVVSKRWDALIGTDAQVDFDVSRLGLRKKIFKAKYIPEDRIKLYIGISKKSKFTEKKQDIEDILSSLVKEGFIDRIVKRYLH